MFFMLELQNETGEAQGSILETGGAGELWGGLGKQGKGLRTRSQTWGDS